MFDDQSNVNIGNVNIGNVNIGNVNIGNVNIAVRPRAPRRGLRSHAARSL